MRVITTHRIYLCSLLNDDLCNQSRNNQSNIQPCQSDSKRRWCPPICRIPAIFKFQEVFPFFALPSEASLIATVSDTIHCQWVSFFAFVVCFCRREDCWSKWGRFLRSVFFSRICYLIETCQMTFCLLCFQTNPKYLEVSNQSNPSVAKLNPNFDIKINSFKNLLFFKTFLEQLKTSALEFFQVALFAGFCSRPQRARWWCTASWR